MHDFTEEEGAALIDGPIPGEGLTQDPKNPQPWEKAPSYTSLEDFIDDLFLNLTEEDNLDGVIDPIRKQIPIEDVAQMLLFQAFSTGKISTDLMLLAVEPTIYMLIGLATYAKVHNPVIYPEESMGTEEDDDITAMEKSLEGGDSIELEKIPVPKGVSKSLVDKLKEGDINGN